MSVQGKKFCRYSLPNCGRLCCWLCENKCKHACTLKCQTYQQVKAREEAEPCPLEFALAEAKKMAENISGRPCVIYYAEKNQAPDPKWRLVPGVLLVRSRGKGPKNMLVSTQHGMVVVPYGNVRYATWQSRL